MALQRRGMSSEALIASGQDDRSSFSRMDTHEETAVDDNDQRQSSGLTNSEQTEAESSDTVGPLSSSAAQPRHSRQLFGWHGRNPRQSVASTTSTGTQSDTVSNILDRRHIGRHHKESAGRDRRAQRIPAKSSTQESPLPAMLSLIFRRQSSDPEAYNAPPASIASSPAKSMATSGATSAGKYDRRISDSDVSERARNRWHNAFHHIKFSQCFQHQKRRMLRKTVVDDNKRHIICMRVRTRDILVLLSDGSLMYYHAVSLLCVKELQIPLDELGMPSIDEGTISRDGFQLVVAFGNRLVVFHVGDRRIQLADEFQPEGLLREATSNSTTSETGDPTVSSPKSKTEDVFRLKGDARCFYWSNDNSLLAVGSAKSCAYVFSKYNLSCRSEIRDDPHKDAVVAVAISADMSLLATGCKDKHARVFVLQDGEPRHMIYKLLCQRVYALDFSPRHVGNFLLIGADDGKIRLCEPTVGAVMYTVSDHTDYVRALAFTSDGTRFFSTGKDGTLRLYDVESAQQFYHLELTTKTFATALGTPAGPDEGFVLVVSGDKSGKRVLPTMLTCFSPWNKRSMQNIATLSCHGKAVTSLAFDVKGRWLASTSSDNTVRVISANQGTIMTSIRCKSAVNSACFHPQSDLLFFGGKEKVLYMANVERFGHHEKVATIGQQMTDMHIAAYGSKVYLALALANKTVQVFQMISQGEDKYTLKSICKLESNKNIYSVRFRPNAFQLAFCGSDSKIRLYDLSVVVAQLMRRTDKQLSESRGERQPKLLWTMSDHNKEVYSLCFSECGTMIASASRDKTVKITDTRTGNVKHTITAHRDHVKSVAFGPENTLASGSVDYTVRVYEESRRYAWAKFSSRTNAFANEVTCVKWAPSNSKHVGMLAVGLNDGSVDVIDYSLLGQQPMFTEVQRVIERDYLTKNYSITADMIEKFPFCVNSASWSGKTLYHLAVEKEDATLLDLALRSDIPHFWLPVNRNFQDALSLAAEMRVRKCIQLILNKIIWAKRANRLAPLPIHENRFLRNVMLLVDMRFSDLVAEFLDQYGLDESPPEVTAFLSNTLPTRGAVGVVGSEERAPKQLWQKHFEKVEAARRKHAGIGPLFPFNQQPTSHLMAYYVAVPFVAGILPSSGPNDILGQTRKKRARARSNSKLNGSHSNRASFRRGPSAESWDLARKSSSSAVAGLLPPGAHEQHSQPAPTSRPYLNVRNSLLHKFLEAGNARLFGNTLMRKVLQYKWEKFARGLFLKELAIFILFLVTWIAWSAVIVEREPDDALACPANVNPCNTTYADLDRDFRRTDNGIAAIVLTVLIFLFAGRQLGREMQQVFELRVYQDAGQRVFAHFLRDKWSLLQVISSLLPIAAGISFLTGAETPTYELASVAAFALWLQILYFLRAFEFTGGLVRMIFRVLGLSVPYLFVMLIVLAGATNVFAIAFSRETQDFDVSFVRSMNVLEYMFRAYSVFLLSEMEATLGQLEDTSASVVLVKLLYVVFSVILTIFMLNLMINLMAEFMSQVHQEEGDAFPFEKARIIAEIEHLLPHDKLHDPEYFPTWLHALVPKSDRNEARSEFQGTVLAIKRDNEQRLQETLRAVESIRTDVASALKDVEGHVIDKLREEVGSLLDRIHTQSEERQSGAWKKLRRRLHKDLEKLERRLSRRLRRLTAQGEDHGGDGSGDGHSSTGSDTDSDSDSDSDDLHPDDSPGSSGSRNYQNSSPDRQPLSGSDSAEGRQGGSLSGGDSPLKTFQPPTSSESQARKLPHNVAASSRAPWDAFQPATSVNLASSSSAGPSAFTVTPFLQGDNNEHEYGKRRRRSLPSLKGVAAADNQTVRKDSSDDTRESTNPVGLDNQPTGKSDQQAAHQATAEEEGSNKVLDFSVAASEDHPHEDNAANESDTGFDLLESTFI